MPRKTLAERRVRDLGDGRGASFAQAVGAARSFQELDERSSEGFSRHLVTGQDLRSGFAVSQRGSSLEFMPNQPSGPREIVRYAKANRAELSDPRQYIGGWRAPDGRLVLDVTRRYGTRKAGRRAMLGQQQEAIYNPQTKELIWNPFHPNVNIPGKKTGYYTPPTPKGTRSRQKRFK